MIQRKTSIIGASPVVVSAILVTAMLGGGCAPSSGTLGWQRADGEAVVRRAVAAHGGLDRWRQFRTVSFDYHEHWSPPFTWFGENPWPRNDIAVHLKLWLHEARAECTFPGDASPSWTWSGGKAEPSGGNVIGRSQWRPGFVIPRTHYLTLLPFKFLDTGAHIEYLRPTSRRERVLVTFGASTGVTPRDRYWAGFNRSTGRLERVVLTVTAYGPLAVGDLRYENYRNVQGVLMPTRITARLNGPELPLHVGEYRSVRFE